MRCFFERSVVLDTVLAALALGLSSCGIGTVSVIASSGDGSSGNAPPTLSGFRVDHTKVSPARIHFALADHEGDSCSVEFFYRIAGDSPVSITQLPGLPGNPAVLAPSPDYDLEWRFDGEAAPFDTGNFVSDVTVYAVIVGGSPSVTPGVNAVLIGLGNDPPEILQVTTPSADESSGTVVFPFQVRDSSADPINVKVEYNVVGDAPDLGWQLTRRPEDSPASPPPLLAIQNLSTTSGGTQATFGWGSANDFVGLEAEVRLRLTPDDGTLDGQAQAIGVGTPVETDSFRIDNNLAPIAFLNNDQLIASSDHREGIPVSFVLLDPESDPVEVILQWRRTGESFEPLPATVEGLRALLADPLQRRLKHICTEFPMPFEGRVGALGPGFDERRQVRLPELAGTEAGLLSRKLGGRALEILRGSSIPELTPWTGGLDHPVAAIPVDDGLNALVLDSTSAGWRVRKISLVKGTEISGVASGAGVPTAMDFLPDLGVLFVASLSGPAWQARRIELQGGGTTAVLTGSSHFGDGLRGLAATSSGVAIATVDDALVRLDYSGGIPVSSRILSGLHRPWGVRLDPLETNRLYVSENAADRILAVDLDSLQACPVPAVMDPARGTLAFPSPRAIALERGGSRLLAVTQESGATVSLRGLDLRSPVILDGGPEASPFVFVITDRVGDPTASISSGADGLRLLALSSLDRLVVGGGLQQRRELVADLRSADPPSPYDPSGQVATVSVPFDPVPTPGSVWRTRDPFGRFPSSPAGGQGVFLWDSRDVVGGGDVHVRIVAVDTDVGVGSQGLGAKEVLAPIAAPLESFQHPSLRGPRCVELADMDGDGDLDMITANHVSNDLTVFLQNGQGSFSPAPYSPLGAGGLAYNTIFVAAGDLDGDCLTDIVAVIPGTVTCHCPDPVCVDPDGCDDSDGLFVYLQTSPGVFAPELRLGDVFTTEGPQSVALGDLDLDGKLDIVSANSDGGDLAVYRQDAAGSFHHSVSLGAGALRGARSVVEADLNGDGLLDLACCAPGVSGGRRVYLCFQTSPGSFDPIPLGVGDLDPDYFPWAIVAGDVDGDGATDLVTADRYRSEVHVLFQSSPGRFDLPPVRLGASALTGELVTVAVADLDCDGDKDLVAGIVTLVGINDFVSDLAVLIQTGPRVFEPQPAVLPIPFGLRSDVFWVRAGDLDGDSDVDLVAAVELGDILNDDELAIFYQRSPGEFAPAPNGSLVDPSIPPSANPTSVAAGDLDGDGDLDLVATYQQADRLTIFFQTSPEQFTLQLESHLSGVDGPCVLAVADLDADGDLDIVTADFDGNDLGLFFQTSPGSFEHDPVADRLGGPGITDAPTSVAVADLDGDGSLDIVSANSASHDLTIFHRRGGIFDPAPAPVGGPATLSIPQSVIAADLDGDDRQDLACADLGSNSLVIFLQQAQGGFSPQTPLGGATFTPGPLSLHAADLDGDGLLDLASSNAASGGLTTFLQVSPGHFPTQPSQRLSPGASPVLVRSADLDEDGDIDLVSAAGQGDNLMVYFQIAPGLFDPQPVLLGDPDILDFPIHVIAIDLDGDADTDLVSANQYSSGLKILWGNH